MLTRHSAFQLEFFESAFVRLPKTHSTSPTSSPTFPDRPSNICPLTYRPSRTPPPRVRYLVRWSPDLLTTALYAVEAYWKGETTAGKPTRRNPHLPSHFALLGCAVHSGALVFSAPLGTCGPWAAGPIPVSQRPWRHRHGAGHIALQKSPEKRGQGQEGRGGGRNSGRKDRRKTRAVARGGVTATGAAAGGTTAPS